MFRWSFLLFLVVGCSSQEKSGFRKTHVITCKHWTHMCYAQAKDRCPQGYDEISRSETQRTGGPHGRYREYKITVGCR